jgi:hypothetical protein
MTAIALFSSVRLRLGATVESHNIKQARDGQRQTPGRFSKASLPGTRGREKVPPSGRISTTERQKSVNIA